MAGGKKCISHDVVQAPDGFTPIFPRTASSTLHHSPLFGAVYSDTPYGRCGLVIA